MKKIQIAVFVLIALAVLSACAAPTPEPTKAPPTAAPQPTKPVEATKPPVTSPVPPPPAATVAPTQPPAAAQPVKLTFWYALSGAQGQYVEAQVKKFNAAQKNITVDVIFQGSYADIAQKLTAAVTAKTLPDIAQMGGAPTMGDSGVIVPIADLMSPADRADIHEGFWDYNKFQDKIVSMPYNNSVPMLYYNKDLFVAAGLDPNKPPTTWDELLKAAQTLTKPGQWGFNTHTDTHWYLSAMIMQNGGKIFDGKKVVYNSPEGIEALTFWGDLVTKHKVMPPNQHANAGADFIAGKVGMLMRSSSTLVTIEKDAKFKVGVAPLPCKKTCSEPLGGASFLVFKTTAEKQKAAWEFAKWMTSAENSVDLFLQTGYVPIRKSVSNVPALKEYYQKSPNAEMVIKAVASSSAIPVFTELGNSDEQLRKAIEKIELGTASAKDALDVAAAFINKALGGP
ncbi:MAG: ABC transporter substrate-binding protein [Chloroflexi bacterium]|nr:ABC transporter substrate-binding protein [Chloroflexota bacterium]